MPSAPGGGHLIGPGPKKHNDHANAGYKERGIMRTATDRPGRMLPALVLPHLIVSRSTNRRSQRGADDTAVP